jgi:dsRNA-specific ribonuclease
MHGLYQPEAPALLSHATRPRTHAPANKHTHPKQLYPFYNDATAFEAASSPAALAAFTSRLGHSFTHPWLLRAALSHASFRRETTPSDAQTLLAWIGDATLQSIATEELVVRYGPAALGGGGRVQAALTVARTQVLSRAGCARAARVLGLGAPGLLLVGDSFKGIGCDVSRDMLGEAWEAVVGAVALDAGRAAARAAFLAADPLPAPRLKDLALVYLSAAAADEEGDGGGGVGEGGGGGGGVASAPPGG